MSTETVRIGSEEHGRLFCQTFIETHRPFRREDIVWPSLGEESLARLRGLPVWDEAARHYDEPALASLVLNIAMINLWNRLNVATRQVAGEWANSAEARKWVETRVGVR